MCVTSVVAGTVRAARREHADALSGAGALAGVVRATLAQPCCPKSRPVGPNRSHEADSLSRQQK